MTVLSHSKGGAQHDSPWWYDRQHSFQVTSDTMKEKYLRSEHAHKGPLAIVKRITEIKEAPLKFTSK